MKNFFILILCAVALCSCNEESSSPEIDLSMVNVELELACIDEDDSSYETEHTILCTGKIGGFTGSAQIEVDPLSYYIDGNAYKSLSIAGANTSFSFTFKVDADDKYTNTPETFRVIVRKDHSYGQILFESSVVIYL